MIQPRVGVQTENKRKITFRQPLTAQDLSELATVIESAAVDEYDLIEIKTIEGGSQRDPIVAGVVLHLEKR